MEHGGRQRQLFRMVAGTGLVYAAASVQAQTGADVREWARWCKSQGGRVQTTSSNPVCVPPSGGEPGTGYTQSQQQMLNLAGQFGSAVGASLREAFEAEARAAEIRRMQRSWEVEQARQNSLKQMDRDRARTATLLANMQGTIGASELGIARTPAGELKLKTGDEAFQAPPTVQGVAVEPDRTPAVRQAWDDYLKALQRKHAADHALAAKQSEREAARKLADQAASEVQQRSRIAMAEPPRSDQRRVEDDRLAEARRLLEEATEIDQRAQAELDAARKEAQESARILAAAEQRGTVAPKQ